METNNLVKSYASKAAQTALFRSVYLWMTLALVITPLSDAMGYADHPAYVWTMFVTVGLDA